MTYISKSSSSLSGPIVNATPSQISAIDQHAHWGHPVTASDTAVHTFTHTSAKALIPTTAAIVYVACYLANRLSTMVRSVRALTLGARFETV